MTTLTREDFRGWFEAHPLIALSIRQPWAHHILHDGKDIENRTWSTNYRGPILIHAGRAVSANDKPDVTPSMPRGGIVGVAEIVDCVQDSDSEWFHGPYGLVLRNAFLLDFLPCKGALGLFEPPITAVQCLRILDE